MTPNITAAARHPSEPAAREPDHLHGHDEARVERYLDQPQRSVDFREVDGRERHGGVGDHELGAGVVARDLADLGLWVAHDARRGRRRGRSGRGRTARRRSRRRQPRRGRRLGPRRRRRGRLVVCLGRRRRRRGSSFPFYRSWAPGSADGLDHGQGM
uniref:Uncharacterized protein n=1 Tax=Arundo donax TaxID=35708 RepID=A0A0A9G916_ARUDO